MTELQTQIVHRATEALTSLRIAETEEDLHLVDVRTGELESLARTAIEHGLEVDELRPFMPSLV